MRVWIRTLSFAAFLFFKLNNYQNTTAGRHKSNEFPPIFWINLAESTQRRDAVLDSFSSIGICSNHFRVPAYDIVAAHNLWRRRLLFHPDIMLEKMNEQTDTGSQKILGVYDYKEAACLLSHLNAIKQAYDAGHEFALILEDDALLSTLFKEMWFEYTRLAPGGWKILQFATVNPLVVNHTFHLRDPFVSWQPYHWSTRAYIINRAGMQTLMDKVYFVSSEGTDMWRIEERPMVVADEVIYSVIGDAYTSTGLWIDSLSYGSTVQTGQYNKHVMGSYHSTFAAHAKKQVALKMRPNMATESMLILMSIRFSSRDEMNREIEIVKQDNIAVCRYHPRCDWEINLVVVDSVLATHVKLLVSTLPSNIRYQIKVSSEPFNKYHFIRKHVDKMKEYDLLLLKDNDLRLSGFPWISFITQRGDAIVSGPLRQTVEDAYQYKYSAEREIWNQFHESHMWVLVGYQTKWSSKLFSYVLPIEVPILEQYFVLFQSNFAYYFFKMILTPSFVDQTVDWGPDMLWCQAAREWADGNHGCHLVPVVSIHEDRRTISRSQQYNDKGWELYETLGKNLTFHRWLQPSLAWNQIIGNKDNRAMMIIDKKCHEKLGIKAEVSLDLQRCLDAFLQTSNSRITQ
mmetsp:Transcript_19012/g.40108  ORF Transcript_19012/g.40108 Transcript_19012/m.40108 type:complete len:627 (-) Transcript_19012:17-1897(-)